MWLRSSSEFQPRGAFSQFGGTLYGVAIGVYLFLNTAFCDLPHQASWQVEEAIECNYASLCLPEGFADAVQEMQRHPNRASAYRSPTR